MEYNIIFAGVGGQGIITLGKLIGSALTRQSLNVLMAETHGLSQRGGSVIVHMRIGDVKSPLVPMGEADLLVGLEMIEAVRNLGFLSESGLKVVNDYIIRPSVPNVKLPHRNDLIRELESIGGPTYLARFTDLAMELGNPIYTNVIVLGAITSLGVVPKLTYDKAIEIVKGLRDSENNLRAFDMGYNLLKEVGVG